MQLRHQSPVGDPPHDKCIFQYLMSPQLLGSWRGTKRHKPMRLILKARNGVALVGVVADGAVDGEAEVEVVDGVVAAEDGREIVWMF